MTIVRREFYNMGRNKKQLSRQILCSLLVAGTIGLVGVAGNAQAADPITVSGNTINNWYPESYYVAQDGYFSSYYYPEVTFGDVTNNSLAPTDNAIWSTYEGAALGGAIYTQGGMDVPMHAKVVNATFQNSLISGNSAANTLEVYGGAMELKGTNATFNDVVITNNTASATSVYGNVIGGAIDASRKGNTYNIPVTDENGVTKMVSTSIVYPTHLTFNVTKDAAFTGNTVTKEGGDTSKLYVYNGYGIVGPSGGGFLTMEPGTDTTFNISDGATLTIGVAGAVTGDTDTISTLLDTTKSANAYNPFIVKQGEGTLTINSNLDKYYGDFTVEGGTVNLNANLNLASTYKVTGGTLNLADVTIDKLYDKLAATGITGYTANADNQTLTADNLYNQEGSPFRKTTQPTSVTVSVANTAGSLTTSAGTTTNANSITVKDGGSINAEGALNITGDLSADASTVTANNATVGGTVSSTNGSTVTLGGDNLSLTSVTIDGTSGLTLTGGKLTADDLAASIKGDGKLTLDGTAVLATNAAQVFTNANTTESEAVDDNALTQTATDNVTFKAGTLSLSDDYTRVYLEEARNVLKAVPSDTSLVMTGTLKAEDGKDVTSLDLSTAQDIAGSDVALDKVTATAKSDANGDVAISNGVNVGALAVDADTKTVSVGANTEVTLGGTETTNVIQTTSTTTTPEVKLAENSTLNIGNNAVTANQELNVKADLVATTATSNINTNGTTTVDGSVSLAGSTLAAKTGTLTVNKDVTAANNSTLTGNVTVNGTIKAADSDSATTVNIGNSDAATNVTVSNVDLGTGSSLAVTKNSTLTLQSSTTTPATVKADVAATGATIASQGDAQINGTVTLTDAAIQSNTGSLAVDALTTAGTSTITGDVAVAGNITGDENTTLNVGTDNTAATISAKSVDLGGGTLYLDPVWQNGDEIGDGSKAAVQTVSDAKLVVGNNSTLTLGSADTSIAEKAFADTGLSWGSDGILSALYVNSSQDLTNNSIVVDSSATATSGADYGTFTMGNNSLLMVNGSAVSGSQAAALTNVSSTNISSSAKLYIDGATKDTTYNILSASAAVDADEATGTAAVAAGDVQKNNAWYADADANTTNVLAHNQLLKFVGADGNGTSQFSVKAVTQDASDVYGNKIVDAAVVTKAIAGSGAAADFFNNAANDEVNATNDQQANAINSAAALTELAGVQHGLYTANNLFDSAVMNHLADGTQDKDIWAHYIHSKEDIDNLGLTGLNGASYEAQYNGVIVGTDFYATKNAVAGAAFTYMDGSIDGSTATAYTKNDADYYGLSLYGRLSQGKTNYLGDISWLHGKNDLTQYNSLTELTGSVSSNAFSAGVRAEQNYKAGIGTLTPYVGLRYAHLDFGDYTDSIGVHHDADTANLWLVPVGLRYSLTSQHGNWNIKPIAEAGYLWTMGDRNGTETVSLDGTANAFGFDLADSGTYYGRLGVEAEKGNLTYGLGYQYQKGDTVRSNTWMGAVRYKF